MRLVDHQAGNPHLIFSGQPDPDEGQILVRVELMKPVRHLRDGLPPDDRGSTPGHFY
jgi:hypothetical protein